MSSREEEISKLKRDIEMYAETERKYDKLYSQNPTEVNAMKSDKYMQRRLDAQQKLRELESRR